MSSRTGFVLITNDKKLIRGHAHTFREAFFTCTNQYQVECSVAFARYLSFAGLNSDNYWLYLRLIMTNNPWVVDELLQDRDPNLLFSTIRPDWELLDAAFEMLFSRHPEEIYTPALEAVLGVIQNAYFDADDGYRIRKLSIMDINALGKFLIKSESQEYPINKVILEILDRIAQVGEYYGEQDKNVLSKHAFNVRYAYFDHTKDLPDAIPHPLLIRVVDRNGVSPEDDFAELVSKRRERKRDSHGRFMKERDPDPVEPKAEKRRAKTEPDRNGANKKTAGKSGIPVKKKETGKTAPGKRTSRKK